MEKVGSQDDVCDGKNDPCEEDDEKTDWFIDRGRKGPDEFTLPLPLPLIYIRQGTTLLPSFTHPPQGFIKKKEKEEEGEERREENQEKEEEKGETERDGESEGDETENEEREVVDSRASDMKESEVERVCWNCESASHELRECPHPRDSQKITKMRESKENNHHSKIEQKKLSREVSFLDSFGV